MKRLAKLALAVAVGGLVGVAVSFASGSGRSTDATRSSHAVGAMSSRQLAAFGGFPLYNLPSGIAGLKLTRATRISPETLRAAGGAPPTETIGTPERQPESRGHRVTPDFVSMIYGSCEASDDSACSTPLEIQIWRACNRYLDDYEIGANKPYPHVAKTIRGTRAAQFDDRLELYAGSVTIVVFADAPLAARVADAIRPANAAAQLEAHGRTDVLPASAPGPDCA